MSRELFTLSFPTLGETASNWVNTIRHESVPSIAPHFTLAFGSDQVPDDAYLAHVAAIADQVATFDIHCRRVVVGTDHRDDTGYCFLTPDEGNSSLHRLHDLIYTGPLERCLSLSTPFIPHMTLGHFETTGLAKMFCDDLNRRPISIAGKVEELTVIVLENGETQSLGRFPFDAQVSAS